MTKKQEPATDGLVVDRPHPALHGGTQIAKCPECGSSDLTAEQGAYFPYELKDGEWHEGEPFCIPERATIYCGSCDHEWTEWLNELMGDDQ